MFDRVSLSFIAQFRGSYPDVPTDPSVDLATLTEGDETPFFVTLPVAQLNAVGESGIMYDEDLMQRIASQIVGSSAIRGHIPPDQRLHAWPVGDAFWVGQMRVDDTLWAKAYVVPGETRDDMRRRKAAQGRLSTSLFGRGQKVAVPGGKILLRDFELEQIDFASPVRTDMHFNKGDEYRITSQMSEEDPNMDRTQVISQMTADDVALLPQTVRDAIVAQATEPVAARIAQMTTENEALKNLVRSMQTSLRGAVIDSVVSQMVAIPAGIEADKLKNINLHLEHFRGALEAATPLDANREAVVQTAQTLWTSGYQAIAEALIAQMAGPAPIVPPKDRPSVDQSYEAALAMAKQWIVTPTGSGG